MTIKDKRLCKVDGDLTVGGTCTHFISSDIDYPSFDDMVGMIQGGAIIMSPEDFNRWKTETETMCRMLGNRCQYESKPVASPSPSPVE